MISRGQRVFVTGLGVLSPSLDGQGLAPAPELGGLLCGRVTRALEDVPTRLQGLALAAGRDALSQAPRLDRIDPQEKAVFVSASKGGLESFNDAKPDLGPWLGRFLSGQAGQALRDDLAWQGGGRNTNASRGRRSTPAYPASAMKFDLFAAG